MSEIGAWELCDPDAPMSAEDSVLRKILLLPGGFAPENLQLLRYSDDGVGDEGGGER